jgi:hypothetical protein
MAERLAFFGDRARLTDVALQMAAARCPGLEPRQTQRSVTERAGAWSRKLRVVQRTIDLKPAWPIRELAWSLVDHMDTHSSGAVSTVRGLCGVTESGAVVQMNGLGALQPKTPNPHAPNATVFSHLGNAVRSAELFDPELDLMTLRQIRGWSKSRPPIHAGILDLLAIADAHGVRLRLSWPTEVIERYRLERHADSP